MITKSSSAKLVGVWAAWHQRLSWAQPPGTDTVFRLSCCCLVQSCKIYESSRETPWILLISAVFFVFLRARHVLSRGAASLTVFSHFLLTGTWPKSCLGATSVLNKFYKIGVRISLITGCRYSWFSVFSHNLYLAFIVLFLSAGSCEMSFSPAVIAWFI